MRNYPKRWEQFLQSVTQRSALTATIQPVRNRADAAQSAAESRSGPADSDSHAVSPSLARLARVRVLQLRRSHSANHSGNGSYSLFLSLVTTKSLGHEDRLWATRISWPKGRALR